jgi:hypothetical protein
MYGMSQAWFTIWSGWIPVTAGQPENEVLHRIRKLPGHLALLVKQPRYQVKRLALLPGFSHLRLLCGGVLDSCTVSYGPHSILLRKDIVLRSPVETTDDL